MPPSLPAVLIAVLVINVATFALFGYDKRCARLQKWRIPEAWLIGMSFATGLFGGWFAMKTFRHKTQKRSFQIKMVLASIFNVAWGLAWFYLRGESA